MKLAILSTAPKCYSTQRLRQAAEQRGHKVKVLSTLRFAIELAHADPDLYFRGKQLTQYDAIMPRIGASLTYFGTAVVRQFEQMDVYTPNSANGIANSRDKLRSLQLLARSGVEMPVTGFAHSTKYTSDLIDLVGGAPLIVKLLEGTQGLGVVLCETRKAAESVIDAFRQLKAQFMVQEFIKEAGGSDLRCFVIGDRVFAAMKRQGKEGEFRSNLHRGGTATLEKISPAERATAVQATKAMGLNVAGVDLLRSSRGPMVLEVNSSPGLEGIEKSTGLDIAGAIVELIEKRAKPGRTKTRGKG